MNVRAAVVIALVALSAGACRVPQGIIDGTVCDAEARGDGLDWWTAAAPLAAMDRVTNALKLKVGLSERMDALRDESGANDGACRQLYYDGYAATHERVAKANADLDALRAARPQGAPYDPTLAMRSFDTHCIAASEMKAFIATVEACLAGR